MYLCVNLLQGEKKNSVALKASRKVQIVDFSILIENLFLIIHISDTPDSDTYIANREKSVSNFKIYFSKNLIFFVFEL